MMPADDNAQARKARAARLREEIARLKSQPGEVAAPPGAPSSESPRDFVERRMSELAKKEKSNES
jgi:hypothetical protein